MPEHVLSLKDTDPPQLHTLRWDQRQFVLTSPEHGALLNLPTEQAVYRIDLKEFFDKQISLRLEDEKAVVFKKNTAAWRDVFELLEKQLKTDENFRYHVRAANRRTFWLGLGLIGASLVAALALVIYLSNANEPKAGVWRFVHRYGLKFGFVILFGLGWAGVSLWLGTFRASRLIQRATREEEWYRP